MTYLLINTALVVFSGMFLVIAAFEFELVKE